MKKEVTCCDCGRKFIADVPAKIEVHICPKCDPGYWDKTNLGQDQPIHYGDQLTPYTRSRN